MKTLFNNLLRKRLQHAVSLAISAAFVLVIAAAALPEPALAATCSAHYTVKSGDTTSKIAHIFDLTWAAIAQANNMKTDARLKVGQSLCIPAKSSGATTSGMMTASAKGNIVTVTMSGFSHRYIWVVNVSDNSKTVSGVFKAGRMIVPADTTVTRGFKLSKDLRKTPFLMVCVKNLTTDDKLCRLIAHSF